MRFVAVQSAQQQGGLMLRRARELLGGQRTALIKRLARRTVGPDRPESNVNSACSMVSRVVGMLRFLCAAAKKFRSELSRAIRPHQDRWSVPISVCDLEVQ